MKKSIKATLTLKCKNMKSPRQQRSLLDQTLSEASWRFMENKSPIMHEDGSVTTITAWQKIFGNRKTSNDIERLTENLLNRAMVYANIDDYFIDIDCRVVDLSKEEFISPLVSFHDD
jgi:hypothetical protein